MAYLIGSILEGIAPPLSDGVANALSPIMVSGIQNPRYVQPDKSQGYSPDPSVGGETVVTDRGEVSVAFTRRKRATFNQTYAEGSHSWIFERLHLTPSSVDLGIVAGIRRVDITAWAAFYYEEEFTSLVASGDPNVTLVMDNSVFPQTLEPFGVYFGELTAFPTGDDVIEATFTFNILGRQSSVLPVNGLRSLFYGFKHNWVENLSETYQWQTSIVTAPTGDEVRSSLRNYPRITYGQSTLVHQDELQVYKNRLFGWFGKNFAVPLWQYQTKLVQPTEVNAFTVKFDNSYMELKAGSRVVVMQDWDDYEIMQVQEVVDSNTITVFSPINSVWAIGSRVAPVAACGMYQGVNTENITDVLSKSVGVQFDLSYLDNTRFKPITSGLIQTYQSEPILPIKPNWAENQIEIFNRPLIRKTDYLAGAPIYFDDSEFTSQTFVLDMKLLSFQHMLLMREFLYTVEGRLKAFWTPTYQQDFTVTDNIQPNSTSILVADNEYLTLVNLNPAKRHLYMELHDGTVFILRIESVVEAPENRLSLGIDQTIVNLIEPHEVKFLCYMHRMRLDTDTVTLIHTAVGVGEMALPCVTIKAT